MEIGALAGLTGLTTLYLENNQIVEIGALAGLTGLTKLYLEKNQIVEIDVLAGLTALTELGAFRPAFFALASRSPAFFVNTFSACFLAVFALVFHRNGLFAADFTRGPRACLSLSILS